MSPQTKYSISTYTGNFFDYLSHDNYPFDIEEIAHSLSHICRYGGHCDQFYSVAEHSVLISQLVSPELALCGLLHDGAEAYITDLPSPLKALCPDYKQIEASVEKSLFNRYSLPYPLPVEVKVIDKQLYKTERLLISQIEDVFWHTDLSPAEGVMINYLPPLEAKNLFLSRYSDIASGKYQQAA